VTSGVQANWLRSVDVKKGDSVAIYMPMLCELPIAMLACARVGAVHTVVFGGFSADSLSSRCGHNPTTRQPDNPGTLLLYNPTTQQPYSQVIRVMDCFTCYCDRPLWIVVA
jgi:hypothetical protein